MKSRDALVERGGDSGREMDIFEKSTDFDRPRSTTGSSRVKEPNTSFIELCISNPPLGLRLFGVVRGSKSNELSFNFGEPIGDRSSKKL